jgi:hypothetical protein
MHTLRHIASVAYTLKNDGLIDLLGYNSYLLDGVLAHEARLAIKDRRAKEPNWFPLLKDYSPNMIAEVIVDGLKGWTPEAETPESILRRILNALAVELGCYPVSESRAKVLAFVRESDPSGSYPDLEPEPDTCPF